MQEHKFSFDELLYMMDLAEGKVIKEVHLLKKGRKYVKVFHKKGAVSKYYLFLLEEYNPIDKYFDGDFPMHKLFIKAEDAENYLKKLDAISFIKHTSWAKLELSSLLKIAEEIKKSEVEEND